jgi:competence protein ComEC
MWVTGEDERDRNGHDRARRRDGLLSAILAASARALEAERDRWILWVPVLFAAGILSYFALADEPAMRVALALSLGALGFSLAIRHARLGLCIGGAALAFASGFAVAKLRTELVRAPVLAQEFRYVTVSGFVEAHELREKGRARLMLRALSVDGLKPEATPYRVRISMPAKYAAEVKIGEAIALRATLQPPPEPIEPGGFDFARAAWFDRLGATGYATSKVSLLDGAPAPPWDLASWSHVDALRAAINARIRAALPGETGAIAVALITGERGGISEDVTESMRDSGLTHILSISGLHMAIMAGTVFWLARALFALVPGLALRYPIKKWAAALALAAATFYLALSGAAVPTVRSWIMMSIVLIAVMLDRPALTMRNVALAALAILLVAPESLFDASFQMSFAAVVALVALYEWLSGLSRMRLRDASPLWGTFHRGTSLLAGAAATTLVAGTAIAPFALYHFHRMTHYGLVANLLAAPLVSVLIMPMALLSLAAMPFGLEFWPLQVMGAGIDLMVATGEWVASWPGAVSILPQISGLALVLIVLGGLWLCLWQTRARMLVIAAFGIALAPQTERPDVLIERGGDTAALRSDAGSLVFPPATAASYSAEKWLLADGDERDVPNATDDTVFRCGVVKGKTVALIRHPGALEEDCRLADIVIAPFTIGKKCRAARVIVDRRMLKAQGAHALFIEGLSIRTETVAAARGQRPWVPNRAIVPAMRRTSPDTGGNQDGAVRDPRGEGNPDE